MSFRKLKNHALSEHKDFVSRESAASLVQHGANPSLVRHYLQDNGAQVTAKDVYNTRQNMSFHGITLCSSWIV